MIDAMRILDETALQTLVLVAPRVMDVLPEDVAREVKDLEGGHHFTSRCYSYQRELSIAIYLKAHVMVYPINFRGMQH